MRNHPRGQAMLGSRMTKGPCVASLLPPLSGRQLTHSPAFVPPHPRLKEPGGHKSGLADVKASAQHGSQVVASVCRRRPDVLLIGVYVPRGHALQVPVQTPISFRRGLHCACHACKRAMFAPSIKAQRQALVASAAAAKTHSHTGQVQHGVSQHGCHNGT